MATYHPFLSAMYELSGMLNSFQHQQYHQHHQHEDGHTIFVNYFQPHFSPVYFVFNDTQQQTQQQQQQQPHFQGQPPASKAAIAQLEETVITADHCTQDCPICVDKFAEQESCLNMPCSHTFHKDCLVPWLEKMSNTCPVCRFEIETYNEEYNACLRERMAVRNLSGKCGLESVGCCGEHSGELVKLDCSHAFHRSCLRTAVKTSLPGVALPEVGMVGVRCPRCRKDVEVDVKLLKSQEEEVPKEEEISKPPFDIPPLDMDLD